MSWLPCPEPRQSDAASCDWLETKIIPRARDLGGFEVRRALPSIHRKLVGPFIFFDQMGPAEFISGGGGIDVRPHPHIGLATVTYLYKGEFQHRDSLGTNRMIYPGEVNWMIAGRGITHSERTSEETRRNPHSLFGIQTWVALPEEHEETNPAFQHCGKAELPVLEEGGKDVRLILGSAYGERAPVDTFSEMFYADAVLQAGARLPLPDDHEERAFYVTSGSVSVGRDVYEEGQLLIAKPKAPVLMVAGERGARLMLLGGETMRGPRYVWWNFVSSSKERIEEAKEAWRRGDWEDGPFTLPPDDGEEFIPLP